VHVRLSTDNQDTVNQIVDVSSSPAVVSIALRVDHRLLLGLEGGEQDLRAAEEDASRLQVERAGRHVGDHGREERLGVLRVAEAKLAARKSRVERTHPMPP
jgi:hypothetical protein